MIERNLLRIHRPYGGVITLYYASQWNYCIYPTFVAHDGRFVVNISTLHFRETRYESSYSHLSCTQCLLPPSDVQFSVQCELTGGKGMKFQTEEVFD